MPRQIGHSTAPVGGRAIEKAHGTLDDQKAVARRKAAQALGRHGPSVEIGARYTAGGLVKAGVDVIGAGFGAAHGQSLAGQEAQQGEGERGLASP